MEAAPRNVVGGGPGISYRRLFLAAMPLAAVGAALVSSVVYLISSALGAIPSDVIVPNAGTPLTVGMVTFTCVGAAVGAALVFAAIARFARRPVRVFGVVAVVVLVLSFATPFSIPGAPMAMILAMETMHVVAAGVIFYTLTAFARAR